LRIRIGRGFWASRLGLLLLGTAAAALVAGAGTFAFYWVRFARMIDARLSGQVYTNTSRVFAAPPRIFVGQTLAAQELTSYLLRAGYTESEVAGAPGYFRARGNAVEIHPSPDSYFGEGGGLRVSFAGRVISEIRALRNLQPMASAELEPELLSNLFDSSREKRRLVRFEDLPKPLVDAVLSAEDKRFFEHPGFDPVRVVGAAWADVRTGEVAQGASTLTMQVSRSFFFTLERRGFGAWRRKLAETMVALQLEQRFSKDQIFELYANEIYLGNRGSFAIHGFGEAAQAYFAKDVRDLTLGEVAFLAGIIRSPNRYSSAERYPDRAAEARDRVLKQMVENDKISAELADAARALPLRFVGGVRLDNSAPYFVDMVKDHLLDRLSEAELSQQSFRIYTTLDPALQRAATEAVALGMQEVDKLLAARSPRGRNSKEAAPQAQVAFLALDPHTGEIKALVGGRDYGQTQLNRVLSRRQPGSVFKPFVYAAAFLNAADGTEPIVTPVTTVVDEPTTFYFEDKEYSPNNYGAQYLGTVTTRMALRHSLNNATVKVAEMMGYGRVVEVARRVGLDPSIQPTPSVALGAYEMTPRDVAAAYTVFANGGARAEPMFIRRVVAGDGTLLDRNAPRTRPALDPRVAYLVTNLLEDVINRGTAAGVRARGFAGPAAGKTGTSHDGWFAGYTSNLLCVVWVGFDDNRELGLSGAASAAPIWAEFMKRATSLPAYRNLETFTPPEGVIAVTIDPETLALATPTCPLTSDEVFLVGSEPRELCPRHGGRGIARASVGWLSGVFGGKPGTPGQGEAAAADGSSSTQGVPPPQGDPAAAPSAGTPRPPSNPSQKTPPDKTAQAKPEEAEKKKGVLERIFGIFGSKKEKEKEKEKEKKSP
jgi:penicillin-binding protein 1B